MNILCYSGITFINYINPVPCFLKTKLGPSFGFPNEEFLTSYDVHSKYGFTLLSIMRPIKFSSLRSFLQYYHLITASKYVEQLKKKNSMCQSVMISLLLYLSCHLQTEQNDS